MAQIINHDQVSKLVKDVIEKEMNKALDEATEEVISKLKNKVREKVASKMIALSQSDYSMEYMRNELCIRVRID